MGPAGQAGTWCCCWNKYAENPYSGAYGIPQAVPGSKMASAGKSWRSNATTQIRWGLGYIKERASARGLESMMPAYGCTS